MPNELLLEIKNLSVSFFDAKLRRQKNVVKGVTFSIHSGEWLCLVGESGSGKSQVSMAITQLDNEATLSGEVISHAFGKPVDLLTLDNDELKRSRGKIISYVFQDPHNSLNPVRTIGQHMVEVYQAHYRSRFSEAEKAALASLAEVHLPEPRRVFDSFGHELSGGMKQRVAIAMSLMLNPRLLVADEPTTALDVTVEREIIDLLKDIRTEWPFSVLYITHDIELALEVADRILVMKDGLIIEEIVSHKERQIQPQHEYTKALFHAALQDIEPKTQIPL